jgi:hypothetical protein
MSWHEKDRPTPFDDKPIEGLWFLDGDILSRELNQSWTKGQKYPVIVFPSGQRCDLWESGDPQNAGTIHLFQLHRVVKWEKGFQPIGWVKH